MQSSANFSPVEFPANREKYREFAECGTENWAFYLSKLQIMLSVLWISAKS